jgi:hypothetical protein
MNLGEILAFILGFNDRLINISLNPIERHSLTIRIFLSLFFFCSRSLLAFFSLSLLPSL